MRAACAALALSAVLNALPAWAQDVSTQPYSPGRIAYRQDGAFGDELLRSGLVLGGIVVVFVGAMYGMRRLQMQRAVGTSRRMKVVEVLRLSPKSTVFLVEVDDRNVLIGQTGSALTLLGEHPRPNHAPAPVRDSNG